MAGRHADMVSVNPRLRAGTVTPLMLADATAERIGQKIAWVPGGRRGRRPRRRRGRAADELSLPDRDLLQPGQGGGVEPGRQIGHRPAAGGSPAVLAGSVDQCVEALQGSRERFGTSYVNVGGDVEAAAPIERRLGGS